MNRKQLINSFIKFFEEKNHKKIENSSLIPKNDPTVLFTTAGMHPLVPFLLGQKHPLGKRLVGIQRCIRTTDIEVVGDKTHHTFFEMLGNWSLGDYNKKESIGMSFEFLKKILKIPKDKISVTCFAGDKNAPKDTESAKIWKDLKITNIKFLGKKDNWWNSPGQTGPCGPDTEIFVEDVEIWNNVFMQYHKNEKGKYLPAKQKNVDTGMGVERTLAILQNKKDNYETEVWKPVIEKIEKISQKKYPQFPKEMRIIADHIKASVFIINDGVIPSNSEQGYVLRRLIRRAIRHAKTLGITNFTQTIAQEIFKIYGDYQFEKQKILDELKKEESKFERTIEKGLKEFQKMTQKKKSLSPKDSFLLYQSYGFPIELIIEESKYQKIKVSEKGFYKELKKHQDLSRKFSSQKFSSGLADNSETTTKLHTATHLLNEALRRVLNKNIKQKGSNITPDRLRFDFNFERKLSPEEIKKIEDEVNKQIKKSLKITKTQMSLDKALESGAQSEFKSNYPKIVSVYSIGDYSKEICTGPHVKNTSELNRFKIIKEESSSAGVRRIKAILKN